VTKAFPSQALRQAFDTRLEQLPGTASLRTARVEAFSRFIALGLPTANDEAWHYTRLDPRQTTELKLASAADTEAVVKAFGIPELGVPQLTFNGGSVRVGPADLVGVHVTTLAEVWHDEQPGDLLDDKPLSALAELNRALAVDGGIIQVPADFKSTEPVYCLFASAEDQSQTRLNVTLAAGAELDLILHHAGDGATTGWNNLIIDVDQGPSSRLTVYRLNELGPEYRQTEHLNANLDTNSRFHLVTADLGGQLCRNELRIRLHGEGAGAELDGLFVANQGQHIDNHLLLDHAASNTTSGQRFQGIGNHRGRGIFNGKVVVRAGTQGVDAKQSSNNLLLAERCEIDTKPELEIYADDVKCSHGATVGELDDEQLYYLQSRGIAAAEARRLLIQAFATTIVERFAIDSVATRVAAALDRQLAAAKSQDS
jgi:Fe-S cluster assembly protein SufD